MPLKRRKNKTSFCCWSIQEQEGYYKRNSFLSRRDVVIVRKGRDEKVFFTVTPIIAVSPVQILVVVAITQVKAKENPSGEGFREQVNLPRLSRWLSAKAIPFGKKLTVEHQFSVVLPFLKLCYSKKGWNSLAKKNLQSVRSSRLALNWRNGHLTDTKHFQDAFSQRRLTHTGKEKLSSFFYFARCSQNISSFFLGSMIWCKSRLDLTGLRKTKLMQKQGKTGRLIPKVDWSVQWVSRIEKAVGDVNSIARLGGLSFLYFTVKKTKFWVFSDRTLIRNWSSRRKAFGWRDERSQGKSTKWMRIFGMKIGSVLGSVLFATTEHIQLMVRTIWFFRWTSFSTRRSNTCSHVFLYVDVDVLNQSNLSLFVFGSKEGQQLRLLFLSLVASKITELMRPRGIWPFN